MRCSAGIGRVTRQGTRCSTPNGAGALSPAERTWFVDSSALHLGTAHVTIVTHDAQMARAATNLAFAVFEPLLTTPTGMLLI